MALELPVLQGLYALQKLVEPLPEPIEITITTDQDYMPLEDGQVGIVIYSGPEIRDKWKEAIEKERDKNEDIHWVVE